jgi:hypothetical protein
MFETMITVRPNLTMVMELIESLKNITEGVGKATANHNRVDSPVSFSFRKRARN